MPTSVVTCREWRPPFRRTDIVEAFTGRAAVVGEGVNNLRRRAYEGRERTRTGRWYREGHQGSSWCRESRLKER